MGSRMRSWVMGAAGAIALRASNTRGEPAATPETQQNPEPSYDPA
jgi:hypothetical protein